MAFSSQVSVTAYEMLVLVYSTYLLASEPVSQEGECLVGQQLTDSKVSLTSL